MIAGRFHCTGVRFATRLEVHGNAHVTLVGCRLDAGCVVFGGGVLRMAYSLVQCVSQNRRCNLADGATLQATACTFRTIPPGKASQPEHMALIAATSQSAGITSHATVRSSLHLSAQHCKTLILQRCTFEGAVRSQPPEKQENTQPLVQGQLSAPYGLCVLLAQVCTCAYVDAPTERLVIEE